ncbi:MAG: TIGR03618 family F420-dependent PPOX class oxidoreductase [Pseudomonadaceae bacterium]|nr:TIGR03618 family F420-dependent PPOX class oxidoreductase [Pseudomonadaceae bacterium]
MFSNDEDAFLNTHRWASLTTLRKNGAPVTSIVAYARDGEDFIVSTPGRTFKRRSIDRDSRVSLCVINNGEPYSYINLEGTAQVSDDDLEALTLRIFDNIKGTGFEAPADLSSWLTAQERVILRITPTRVNAVLR